MFGAICGDILGSTAEFDEKKFNDIEKISLCLKPQGTVLCVVACVLKILRCYMNFNISG